GGGGFLAGVAFAVKNVNPKVRVIGVQAERADAMVQSFHQKKHVALDNIFTIADGIAVKNPGELTCRYMLEYVDDMVTVSDDEIASTIIMLMERTKMVVEPAGAASLAAAIHGKIKFGKCNACILSGGNIDVGFISKIIERGLVSRGRQLKFSVILVDKPGSLENFAHVMAKSNANIVSVQYDRMSTEMHLNETILHVACEVSGFDHGKKVIEELERLGFRAYT
ncbi:MAG: pyridoxal-phosphate dependent enzyme, partial [Spirochaetaceae bacterium]|nr:pyridoxal-phosphate dependent enzyme [Spirochaetaceae bacterium]